MADEEAFATGHADVFRAWDTDRNGKVTRREFGRMLPAVGMGGVDKAVVNALWRLLDADGSGEIDRSELDQKLRRAFYELSRTGSGAKK